MIIIYSSGGWERPWGGLGAPSEGDRNTGNCIGKEVSKALCWVH